MYAAKTLPHGRKNGSMNGSATDSVPRMKSQKSKDGSKDSAPPALPANENMSTNLAERIRVSYWEKMNINKPYELVAAFQLDMGIVQSFYVFPRRETDVNLFELTERRRRLLHRYYQRGRQYVVLYLKHMHENYLPIRLSSRVASTSRNTSTAKSRRILDENQHNFNQSSTSSSSISGQNYRTSLIEQISDSTESTEGSGKSCSISPKEESSEERCQSNLDSEKRCRKQRYSQTMWSWLKSDRKSTANSAS